MLSYTIEDFAKYTNVSVTSPIFGIMGPGCSTNEIFAVKRKMKYTVEDVEPTSPIQSKIMPELEENLGKTITAKTNRGQKSILSFFGSSK